MVFHPIQFVFGGNVEWSLVAQYSTALCKDYSSVPNLLKTVLMTNTEIIVKMLKREGRPLEVV